MKTQNEISYLYLKKWLEDAKKNSETPITDSISNVLTKFDLPTKWELLPVIRETFFIEKTKGLFFNKTISIPEDLGRFCRDLINIKIKARKLAKQAKEKLVSRRGRKKGCKNKIKTAEAIPNEVQDIINVLAMIRLRTEKDAKDIVNRHDIFSSKVKSIIMRVYNDNQITENNLTDLANKIHNEYGTNIPSDEKETIIIPDSLEMRLQLAAKREFIQYYYERAQELRESTLEDAKQRGIKLSPEEIPESFSYSENK